MNKMHSISLKGSIYTNCNLRSHGLEPHKTNIPVSVNSPASVPWKKFITKTCLYNIDPLKPHFYIVKLRFTGVCIIFLIPAQKHRLWVLVRTASSRRFLRVPTIYVLSRNKKNISFLYENFQFLEVKFSLYSNRHVFVMCVKSNAQSSREPCGGANVQTAGPPAKKLQYIPFFPGTEAKRQFD